ncbi:cytochrome c oxidase assembly factor 4 homolog, mitochondrial-like isoform X2 [Leptopilina boulardi]|uniref:cytochrome c oxidase assembly factor 4 homolog, mitochondrial-like isoform X2 n=1 Tax=Leptopilina boulardi TaxID=63433 RepID=UPI0021F5C589|nr:cytochrome c oxidase assembly factor 4 homolog, mitochondrial-like isoform X2 [Leptopilina boulardi]
MTESSVKNVNKTNDDDDIDDPLERMLKKTGCMELHFKVQECIAETQDWRKCKEQVNIFRTCMEEYQRNKNKK